MNYPRILLASTSSGAGKTTLVLGISLALQKKGLKVQPFKVGPDYIDPSYHRQSSKNICRNLDSWLLSKNTILELFECQAALADISIIEGVMGLYDGIGNKERGSSAHIAKILRSPIILIVNAKSMSRSAGAVVLGYKKFDQTINIKGVILNNIGSQTHYNNAKESIEKVSGIPVLGFLPKDKNLNLTQRHLGLIPTQEKKISRSFYKQLSNLIKKNIDLTTIIKISQQVPTLDSFKKNIFGTKPSLAKVNIALAKDEAFNFYYQDNLDILQNLGADLVEFSPLKDKKLPKGINGLYIGGGFPELFASRLEKNIKLKRDIYRMAKSNLPIYAECGGLMFLMSRLIDFKGKPFKMTGLFPGEVTMSNRLRSLGYAKIEALRNTILSKKGSTNKAHLFHWSYLNKIPKNTSFAYKVRKSNNDIFYDGLIKGNVLASYAHLHFASNLNLAKNFIKHCLIYKKTIRKIDAAKKNK